MSKPPVTQTEIELARREWMAWHKRTYLESGGAEGHILDLRDIGGLRFTTTLLLETVGAKSGQKRLAPLIYGDFGGEVIVVASKGGADIHPSWYPNIKASKEVTIQIATQAFRATWREPAGAERAAIWDFMAKLYPPYVDYKAATKREIPLVMFTVTEPADILKPRSV